MKTSLVVGLAVVAFGMAVARADSPAAWPPIKVDGIMARGGNGTVILNGRMMGVGEGVSGVEVVSIQPRSVTLRFQGRTLTLAQGQSTETVEPAAVAAPPAAAPASAETPATGKGEPTAWQKSLQGWAAGLPAGLKREDAKPAAGVATAAADAPRNLEAEVIAEHMRQNPDLHARLRAQQQQSMAAANALRNDPKTGPIARIFLPPRRSAPSGLQVMQDQVDAHLGYLTHSEVSAGRTLMFADVSAADPEGFMLVPGMFLRGTLWALQREGPESALRFACGFIDSYRARKAELEGAWGSFSYEELLASMFWMTAGAQEAEGDGPGARATLRSALAANLGFPLVPSLRYMDARAAHRAGQDFEASEILRALVEDAGSKDALLRLPDESRDLGSVYSASVSLLNEIRGGAK